MQTFRDLVESEIGLLDIPIHEFTKNYATNHIKGGINKTQIKTIGDLLNYDVKKFENAGSVGAKQIKILKSQLTLFYLERLLRYHRSPNESDDDYLIEIRNMLA